MLGCYCNAFVAVTIGKSLLKRTLMTIKMISTSKWREIVKKYQNDLKQLKEPTLESSLKENEFESKSTKEEMKVSTSVDSQPVISTVSLFRRNSLNDDTILLKFIQNKILPLEDELEVSDNLDLSDKKEEISEHRLVNENERIDYRHLDIFHRALAPIAILGQCSFIMPVMGMCKANPKHLRFTCKSFVFMWTCGFLVANSLLNMAYLKHLSIIGINAKNMVGLVFFSNVFLASALFLSLAKRWPAIIQYWTKVELIFIKDPYQRPKRNLAARIQLAAVIIIMLGIAEHIMYLSSAIATYRQKTVACVKQLNMSGNPNFDEYVLHNYDYIFQLVPFSTSIGVGILIVNGACTFIWNYMDLFIMMISKGIAYRFEQVTMRINSLADKEVPESVFIEIREHYVKLCELLDYIDENLSGLILLSCINNLYFVCYQLLNVFNRLRLTINYIYFWYSLLFLIGRTAFVFLSAATINDQSKGALGTLRRVSRTTWCIEVERLIFQMGTQTVALSGKKFYYLTRRLLFGMAGTIVTYELVLLQFDEPNRSKGLTDICS